MSASLVVSSAASLGYGTLRAVDAGGAWANFGPNEIRDPRGVRRNRGVAHFIVNEPRGIWILDLEGEALGKIPLPDGIDPGGGAFAPEGTYYVGSRARRSLERIDLSERRYCGRALNLDGIFPRGFAVLDDGTFIVASATDPTHGGGRRAILRYDSDGESVPRVLVEDEFLDPLDLAVRDNHVYVTSEYPFGNEKASVSLRCYDLRTGKLEMAWSKQNAEAFTNVRKPRGIAFDDSGTLVVCAQNAILAINPSNDSALAIARDERLAGQSLAVAPGVKVLTSTASRK